MTMNEYDQMLSKLHTCCGKTILILWQNGLKVKCRLFLSMSETSDTPEEEERLGVYYSAVDILEIINAGTDDSVRIYNDTITINKTTIPDKIMLEDGTIVWERETK